MNAGRFKKYFWDTGVLCENFVAQEKSRKPSDEHKEDLHGASDGLVGFLVYGFYSRFCAYVGYLCHAEEKPRLDDA